MATFGKQQWMMIGGAAVVTVLLLLAPRTPKEEGEQNAASARVSEDPNSGSTPHAQDVHGSDGPMSSDPRVNAILAEVDMAIRSGVPPMGAITKLRSLADSLPDNVEAQYHMGLFSWQSKQYDKAIKRFENVVALSPDGYPDAWGYLGRAYATLDSTKKAIAAIEKYKTLVTDTSAIAEADRFIIGIKQTKGQ